MKALIERNLNSILLISVIAGLFLPNLENTSNNVVTFLLALIVLFLSSRIDFLELKEIKIKPVLIFYILRFIVLPIILFYVAELILPKYSIAILLLTLLPVGITTPMLVAQAKGNVTFALTLTIVTSLIAPFMIPLIFSMMGYSSSIEINGLFTTLLIIILIPIALQFGLVSLKKELKPWFNNYSSFVSTVLLGIIIAIVVSKQKEVFLNDVVELMIVSVVLLSLFFLYYLFGWFYPIKRNQSEYIVCNSFSSGAINTALGINLALLYFSKDTLFFLVISEFVWVISIPMFNVVRKRLLT